MADEYGEAIWKRDPDEYKELALIESRLNNLKRIIGGTRDSDGTTLNNQKIIMRIKDYNSEMRVYFDWLIGHIMNKEGKKRYGAEIKEQRLVIESLISDATIMFNEGRKKMTSHYLPDNFNKTYLMLNMAERRLRVMKIKLGLSVTIKEKMSQSDWEKIKMDGTIL